MVQAVADEELDQALDTVCGGAEPPQGALEGAYAAIETREHPERACAGRRLGAPPGAGSRERTGWRRRRFRGRLFAGRSCCGRQGGEADRFRFTGDMLRHQRMISIGRSECSSAVRTETVVRCCQARSARAAMPSSWLYRAPVLSGGPLLEQEALEVAEAIVNQGGDLAGELERVAVLPHGRLRALPSPSLARRCSRQ